MSPVISYIGLPKYEILEVDSKRSRTLIKVATKLAPECPDCGCAKVHSKGPYERCVKHQGLCGSHVDLLVQTRRYRCCKCNRHFVPELPGIRRWYSCSEPLREQIYQDHHDGICASRVAEREQISAPTVSRTYAAFTERKASERQRQACPTMLGIDEHTLHRNGKYVTTFCDLKAHKVFDVVEGRSGPELAQYLRGLRGRDKVRVVCIDMSHPYRKMIRGWFPKARIVADRFHAVRIVMQHFLDQIKELEPEIKYNRRYIRALRKRPEKLSDYQKKSLAELFERYPVMEALYRKMREICDLFNKKTQSKKSCRKHARSLVAHIQDLRTHLFDKLHTLAHTLEDWSEQIACMWRFRKNNSIIPHMRDLPPKNETHSAPCLRLQEL
jgi:transposase